MLTIRYPSVHNDIQSLDYGLLPIYIRRKNQFVLVIKASKESILTAKINNELKIYLITDGLQQRYHLGLITAFFDDYDEPLVIKTPLFKNSSLLKDISSLLSQKKFEIYFFDENNRECMGAKGLNVDFERFSLEIERATFCEFEKRDIWATLNLMDKQFAMRNSNDDLRAYTIRLGNRLFPDDIIIIDNRKQYSGFNDSIDSVAKFTLQRENNPGQMQERDISLMISRVFDDNHIYINPSRNDTGQELTDILVVTEKIILLIQAKDSPNTEEILSRHIERKRKTILSHIKKASDQLRGALVYALDNDAIILKSSPNTISIPVIGRQLLGMVVVKEIFDDEYIASSEPVLSLADSIGLPSILMDYNSLHLMTQHLKSPELFVKGLLYMFNHALTNNAFPKAAWLNSSRIILK